MSKQWYYMKGQQQFGPISWRDLYLAAQAGTINPGDLVWVEGLREWIPASKIKGLIAQPPAAAPAPWYYMKGQQQFGPISWRDLYLAARAGTIKPGDLVWVEGLPEWTPASDIKGLIAQPPGGSRQS